MAQDPESETLELAYILPKIPTSGHFNSNDHVWWLQQLFPIPLVQCLLVRHLQSSP